MSDVEETESLADQSFYILNNNYDQRAPNFNIFQQNKLPSAKHHQHNQSMNNNEGRPQLI